MKPFFHNIPPPPPKTQGGVLKFFCHRLPPIVLQFLEVLRLLFYKEYNILYLYNGGDIMDVITYSDLRRNLKTYMDKVYYDYEPLLIARKNSENLVLLSVHEYNSLIETDYLLRDEANAKHLKKSVEQHKNGHLQKHELLENE